MRTPNYGVITAIQDDTTAITVKDDNDNELVVEVLPVMIDETHIQNILQEDTNRWIIKYMNSIPEPSNHQIQQAINTGQLLQVVQTVQIVDNYGLSYRLTYNKEMGVYENKNRNLGQLSNLMPLNDIFIDYLQQNETASPLMFPPSSRILYKLLQEQLAQTDMVKLQEQLSEMGSMVKQLTDEVNELAYRVMKLEGR